MADATKYGNAIDFNVDLHSVYAAYLGLFESDSVDWWDKSWGGYFNTFNDFLGFGWEVMVVVDSVTGRPHIAVRADQIALFAKMIRTRFGESLAKDPPTTLPLNPVPTKTLSLRRLLTIHDLTSYRKLAQSLPAAELSYLRSRVRSGEVDVLEQLFYAGGTSGERDTGGVGVRDNGVGYTWACVKTTWWEKGGTPQGLVPGLGRTQPKGPGGKGLVLEVGLAVIRCANLRAVNVWPPLPEENYRKSHFIAEEWVDKRTNTAPPSYPRAYAFGRSRYVAEKDGERIVDATLGALASQENDANANQLVLLSLGEPSPLPVPLASTLPANVLQTDVLALEFNLLRRAQSQGIAGTPDRQIPLTSLNSLLQALQIPVPAHVPLGNAGNEAFYTVLAFQKLMMAETRLPDRLFQPPEGYMNGYNPYPYPHASFNQYPLMPPTRPTDTRRTSNSSMTRPNLHVPSFPSSPVRGPSRERHLSSGDLSRPRPASFGDTTNNMATPRRQSSAEHDTPRAARAPRQSMQRSQTVFWDDAEYASSPSTAEQRGRGERVSEIKAGHQSSGTSTSEDSSKGRQTVPPSSFKSLSGGPSSRSISWDDGSATTPDEMGPPNALRSSRHSSAASSPRRPAMNVSASGSSLKLASAHDRRASSDRKDTKESGVGEISGSTAGQSQSGVESKDKDKNKLKAKPSKTILKTDKSVKDIAGALARFWVG